MSLKVRKIFNRSLTYLYICQIEMTTMLILTCVKIYFFSMASKPINICSIRTGCQPYWKITYSIVLQTIFHSSIQIKILKLIPILVAFDFGLSWLKQQVSILIIFHFDIRGKLSIIRCDKLLLSTYTFTYFIRYRARTIADSRKRTCDQRVGCLKCFGY